MDEREKRIDACRILSLKIIKRAKEVIGEEISRLNS
jgi:hypothetical protein